MIKIKTFKIYKFLFLCFLLICVSRGFFELYFEKKTAFIIQVLTICAFMLISVLIFRIKLSARYFVGQTYFLAVFIFAVIISIFMTMMMDNGGAPIFYSGIMSFLSISFIVISSLSFDNKGFLNVGPKIVFVILLLFGVSLYEQLSDTLMPGAWWIGPTVRPASLTGSKQHYSIIVAILSLYLFQYWLILKNSFYLLGFGIGVIAVFLSLSRSGSMILVFAFIPFFIYKLYSIRVIKVNLKWILITLIALTMVIVPLFFVDFEFFWKRVLSSIDTKAAGNGDRLKSWALGMDLILSSNILFGEYTGVITNSTRTITNIKSFVVESGTLQTILNFGLIGFISFYSILFNVHSKIKKGHTFLLITLFSCLLSTMVYQSIETIPFIILLSLIPIISSDIEKSRNLLQL